MNEIENITARIFSAVSRCGVPIFFATQANFENSISFCIREADISVIKKDLKNELFLEINAKVIERIDVLPHQSIISIVSDQIYSNYGIASKLFSALAAQCINVKAITQAFSARCISVVIDDKESKRALCAVHSFFFCTTQPVVLYIFRVGTIGKGLLEQIKERQQQFLEERIEIKVVAISNSKQMIYTEEGIDLSNWSTALNTSDTPSDLGILLEKVSKTNPLNGIFVDCTSSGKLA
nr:hypothetical protein [Candidatus Trichorickettsia mobilis]